MTSKNAGEPEEITGQTALPSTYKQGTTQDYAQC